MVGENSQMVQFASVDPPPLDWMQSGNTSQLLSTSDSTVLSLNTSTLKDDYDYACDESLYGSFTRADDCLSAVDRIVQGKDRLTFAMRQTPEILDTVFPLPMRFMGG